MLARTLTIAALLTMTACGSNKQPVATISHPPTADLTCPGEPEIDAMLAADPSGLLFDVAVRSAGQACRDAVARLCRWHKERGLDVTCPRALEL
jgi:hypothetical protein